MSLRCIPAFVLLFSCQYVYCFPGDPVMYLPPFEVRTLKSDRIPGFVANQQFPANQQFVANQQFADQQFADQQFAANRQFVPDQQIVPDQQLQPKRKTPQSQPIMHTNVNTPVSKPRVEKEKEKPVDGRNFTLNDLLEAMNTIEDKKEGTGEASRASEYDYQQYPPYDYWPPSYGYQRPSPYSHGYHEPPAAYVHPTAVHHPGSKFSLDFAKPVATKVAGKVSGLIGLVLALLTGSAPNDIELKGFKDIVINGIVKPLLVAKGGLKTLISKLTIPVISLLLINLEVLITIWWLWEDCQETIPAPPPYSYPKPHGYNSYRQI